VFASCFPTYAPRVFCCFDQPDLRADLTLSVAAPAGWDCVASSAPAARPPAGQAGTWQFETVPAMKPYELSLCAGPYVTVADTEHPGLGGAGGPVTMTVRSRATLAGVPGQDRVSDILTRVLRCYEDLFGVPMPYRQCAIVFVPDLGPLAMCLPGAIFVSETLLGRLADENDIHSAVVLAHEAAHFWFGCLVEGRWWDDLWLAEAMATYVSYVAAEQALGLDAVWADFALAGQASAYRADTLPGADPVAAPVPTAAQALTLTPAIVYSKGASVIRQLAALIGDDALRAGLRAYLARFGGATATLADLISCCSAASGRDLAGWAAQWLGTAGVTNPASRAGPRPRRHPDRPGPPPGAARAVRHPARLSHPAACAPIESRSAPTSATAGGCAAAPWSAPRSTARGRSCPDFR